MKDRVYVVLVLLFANVFVFGQSIAVKNTSSPSKKKGYYDWSIFIEANAASLAVIDHVEYLLHPTFANPQVSSYNRKNNFSYSSSGWGEFEIKAKVIFNNKKPPQYLTYWLRLSSKTIKK